MFRLTHSLSLSPACPLQEQEHNTKILIKVLFLDEDMQTWAGWPGWTEVRSPGLPCVISLSNCFLHLEVITSTSQFTLWRARLCLLFLCPQVGADPVSTMRYLLRDGPSQHLHGSS